MKSLISLTSTTYGYKNSIVQITQTHTQNVKSRETDNFCHIYNEFLKKENLKYFFLKLPKLPSDSTPHFKYRIVVAKANVNKKILRCHKYYHSFRYMVVCG